MEIKSKYLISIIAMLLFIGYIIGWYIGYTSPNYKVKEVHWQTAQIYEVRLIDHENHEFVLIEDINKFYAMGVNTNDIILKSNE